MHRPLFAPPPLQHSDRKLSLAGKNETAWLFHALPNPAGQRTLGHLMRGAALHRLSRKGSSGRDGLRQSDRQSQRNFKDGFGTLISAERSKILPPLGFRLCIQLPQGIQGSPYLALRTEDWSERSELREWKKGTYENSVIKPMALGLPTGIPQGGPHSHAKALDYIRRHIARNRESSIRKPFFMHYCSQSCHVPHTPPIEIAGQRIKGTTPDYHLDMLVEADATLGLMIEELRRHGELENTLILFTSDNGGLARGPLGKPRWGHNSNAGLRGSKAQILRVGTGFRSSLHGETETATHRSNPAQEVRP